MTIQQTWESMSKKERKVNNLMCYMKRTENGSWDSRLKRSNRSP